MSAPKLQIDVKNMKGGSTTDVFAGVDLTKFADKIIDESNRELKSHMNKIRNAARKRLAANKSVKTGALRKSIMAKVVKTKSGGIWAGVGIQQSYSEVERQKNGKGIVHRPIKYAHLVERGFTYYKDGKKIDGKPFLKPATAEVGGDEVITAALDKITKKIVFGE